MKRYAIICGVICAAITVILTTPCGAADVTIKFATASSGDHINIEVAEYLKREIEKRTEGKVDFKIFPGGQLGSQKATMSGLRQGTHEMSLQASPMARIEPAFGVFEAPFLFADHEEAKKAVKAVEADIKQRVLEKNIVVLAIGALGFRQISNNIRPIVVPGDLNGVKLRTPDNPFRITIFKQFGANPTPMTFSEVYVALRQGVIDGQENPLGSIWGAKFYEVQKYISLSNHIFTPNALVASKFVWDRWPKDVQKVVQEVGTEVMDWSFQRDIERDGSLRKKMEAHVAFNKINSSAFKKTAAPLYEELEKKVPENIWNQVMSLMK
jgi:tripartite ATP-independent transporter DctP family solute receptor